MEPAASLSSELSQPLSNLALGQLASSVEWLSPQHPSSANAVFYIHCSPPLLCLSMEAPGVTNSHCMSTCLNYSFHAESPNSGISLLATSLFIISIGFSSHFRTFLGPGTHFPLPCLPCIDIFQHLNGNTQTVSFSALYYTEILVQSNNSFFCLFKSAFNPSGKFSISVIILFLFSNFFFVSF